MRAIEFQTKLHSSDSIDIPEPYQGQLKSDQNVRVIVLIDDSKDDDESREKLTTKQFFSGYSDEDAVYDKLQ